MRLVCFGRDLAARLSDRETDRERESEGVTDRLTARAESVGWRVAMPVAARPRDSAEGGQTFPHALSISPSLYPGVRCYHLSTEFSLRLRLRRSDVPTPMRRATLLSLALLAVAESATLPHPSVATAGRRSFVGPFGRTLVDTTVGDDAGWCHISLVQPTRSGRALLHMTLCGKGSRSVGTSPHASTNAVTRGLTVPCACCVRSARHSIDAHERHENPLLRRRRVRRQHE